MSTISANELKKGGVSAMAPLLAQDGEAVITVRGRNRYVVMTVERYNELREAELVCAVGEARADYKAGRIDDKTVSGHMQRLHDEL